MALIKCPECGKEISDRAVSCPNCGFPLKEGQYDNITSYEERVIPEVEPSISDKYIWLMSGALVLGIFLGLIKAPLYAYIILLVINTICIIKDSEQLDKAGIRLSPVYLVLGIMALVPIYVIVRAVKTKRTSSGVIYSAIFIVMILFTFRNNKTSQELLDYINSDMIRLGQIETEMINSYNSVAGVNYTDDLASYDEIKNVTLPAARKLTSEANTVYNRLSSKEIKEVHLIYLDICNEYCEAFDGILEGLEKQDVTTVRKAVEKIEQINALATDYQNAIKQLAEKYGLEWQPIEQYIQA